MLIMIMIKLMMMTMMMMMVKTKLIVHLPRPDTKPVLLDCLLISPHQEGYDNDEEVIYTYTIGGSKNKKKLTDSPGTVPKMAKQKN